MPFDNIGESHMLAQVKKCHDAFHRDWLATATDVVKKDCVKARKQKNGPAGFYARAVGSQKGERKMVDFYMWGKENETYLINVEYQLSVFKSKAIIDKGRAFVKAIKKIREKAH